MSTVVYLMRHSKANQIKLRKKETLLESNKKIKLSREGKKIALEFSNDKEFRNIDVVISSDYQRAIGTAFYFVEKKDYLLIDHDFGERVHGVNDFSELPYNFEYKQMEDKDFKVGYGESQKEVQDRMFKALQNVVKKYHNKRVLVVSHATAITFLLKKWCEINYMGEYKYKDKVIFDDKFLPCTTFKLTFDDNDKLVDIDSIHSEISVMSFNLRHIIKEELIGLWKKRYEKIVNYIKEQNMDIIGVQELTRKGKRYLKKHLKEYDIVGKRRHSIIFTNEYNCILVKKDFKIKGHKTYSLSDKINILGRKGKKDNFPRICTLIHLEKENKKYLVANTHIDNSNTDNKKNMLDIFDNIVKSHKKGDEYLIITGDFNMTLDNKNLVRYAKDYIDPFKNYTEGTFPSVPDMKALDHIFLDKRLTYHSEKIHSWSNDDGFMSDHYPISCIVRIK